MREEKNKRVFLIDGERFLRGIAAGLGGKAPKNNFSTNSCAVQMEQGDQKEKKFRRNRNRAEKPIEEKKKKKKKQRVAEFVDPRAGGIRVPRGFLIARARGSGTRGGSSRRFPRQGEGELGIGDFGAGGIFNAVSSRVGGKLKAKFTNNFY